MSVKHDLQIDETAVMPINRDIVDFNEMVQRRSSWNGSGTQLSMFDEKEEDKMEFVKEIY